MKNPSKGVVIGCFGGFWGDSMAHAVAQFLRSKEADSIDYLVSDYLAEVTMCILAKKKARPSKSMGVGGFCEDFVTQIWKPLGKMIRERNIKVVVNAGGMNPEALKKIVEEVSKSFPEELRPTVAAVVGDDLLPRVGGENPLHPAMFNVDGSDDANDEGIQEAMKRGENFNSLHVYIGARGITRALAAGANVVVTGRCVDSALVLGPLVHEFGWNYNSDFDKLACGTIAGHAIECGAQCTGGNFTDWELGLQRGLTASKLFENIGFPIAEVQADGEFIITKPSGTGGIVSRLSVGEQLVYEIGDTKGYIVADCVADVTHMAIEEVGKNRVKVTGVKGKPPTGFLKATATYNNGYIGILTFVTSGHNAVEKGKAIAQSLLGRTKKILSSMGAPNFSATRLEFVGTGDCYFPQGYQRTDTYNEVVVRLAVLHPDSPKPIFLLASQFPSASTGMSPGLWALTPGKPSMQEAVALRTGLIGVDAVDTTVIVGDANTSITLAKQRGPITKRRAAVASLVAKGESSTALVSRVSSATDQHHPQQQVLRDPLLPTFKHVSGEHGPMVEAPLITIACCRSGDKGDAANCGILARQEKYFGFIAEFITEEVVLNHLESWQNGQSKAMGSIIDQGGPDVTKVERFPLYGAFGFNFVLTKVLGGGGLMSLKGDKQGKSIGSILLCLRLPMPTAWVDEYNLGVGAQKAQLRSRL